MKARWVVLVLGFVFLGAVAIAGIEYLGKTRVDPVVKNLREIQERHWLLFTEDQTFLHRFEIFNPVQSGAADAGPRLNPRIRWTPETKEAETTLTIRIPPEFNEQILRYRNDWMRHHSRLLKRTKIDFSLFEGLTRFDHWNIEKNGPQARLIEEGRFLPPDQIPVPSTIDLMSLAKLRLAWGAQQQTPLEALRQVRALARLLFTTENIQLFSSGLAILDFERLALRYYLDRGLVQEGQWEPVPRNITRRASRAIWATRGYFHIWTMPEIFQKVFLAPVAPIGLCEAVNAAAPKELSLRPLLETRWPLERDFRRSYDLLDQAIAKAQTHCRLRYLTRMIELNRFESEFPLPGFLTTLPYSRKVFGLRIATLPFVGFEAYDASAK